MPPKKKEKPPKFVRHTGDTEFPEEAYYDPSLITQLLTHLVYKRSLNDGIDEEEYSQNLSKLKGLLDGIKDETLYAEVIEALVHDLMDKLIKEIKKNKELYAEVCYKLVELYVTGVSYCCNYYLYNKKNVTADGIDAISPHCGFTLPNYFIELLDKYTIGLFLTEDEPFPSFINKDGSYKYYFFNTTNYDVREAFEIKYSLDKYIELFNFQFEDGPFSKVLEEGTILYRGIQKPPEEAKLTLGVNSSYLSTSLDMTVAIEHATDVYGEDRGHFLKPGNSSLIQYTISGRVPTIDLSLVEEYYINNSDTLAPMSIKTDNLNSIVYSFLWKVTKLAQNTKNASILKQKAQEFLDSEEGQMETAQVRKEVAELIDANLPFKIKSLQSYRFRTLGVWQEEYILPIGCESAVMNNNDEDIPMPKSVASYTPNKNPTIKKIDASILYRLVGGRKINRNQNKKYRTTKNRINKTNRITRRSRR